MGTAAYYLGFFLWHQKQQNAAVPLGGDNEADFYVDSALNTCVDGVYGKPVSAC